MKVKICGLTTFEDALAACEAGADLLGFNFYPPSPRSIHPEICALITARLKPRFPQVSMVGVFVNAGSTEIHSILEVCHLDLAQLSGDEPPAVLLALGNRAFKALRPANPEQLASALGIFPLRKEAPCFLIDAYRKGEYGGTGLTADWSLAKELAARYPLLLAGGLTPENVSEAILQTNPWGVDVASGVESKPGVKDLEKVWKFIQAAKAAD
jgi:phosphoribosylanthranilate isomerase